MAFLSENPSIFNDFIARVSNVTGVTNTRPERWRDGEGRHNLSQSSPVGKMKPEAESKDDEQSNPNESLSDWEQEFLGEIYRMHYDSWIMMIHMLIGDVNIFLDDISIGDEDAALDGVSDLFD